MTLHSFHRIGRRSLFSQTRECTGGLQWGSSGRSFSENGAPYIDPVREIDDHNVRIQGAIIHKDNLLISNVA